MTKRALLIGSPYGGLTGVGNDIDTMSELLCRRGFQVERCDDRAATREGILEAWQRLVGDTEAHDAVTVYYSGHGGLAEAVQSDERDGAFQPWRYQFIVPMDYGQTNESDFRGISSPELSRLLRDLTARTRNVTLILDCCHAARMSRDLGMVPKALPRTQFLGVAAHLDRLRTDGLLEGPTFVEGNPDAVRVVASATTESAYEYTNAAGRRTGVLTEALDIALGAIDGAPVSWRSVLMRVRERVLAVVRQQHPDVEGPADRIVFGFETADMSGVLGVGLVDGTPNLRGGRIVGVEEDDLYSVMPHGSVSPGAAGEIGRARVVLVRGTTAEIVLSPEEAQVPAEGALAFPIRKALRRSAVLVDGDGPFADQMRDRLAASRFVQKGGAGDVDSMLATVHLSGEEVIMLDRAKLPLVWPREADHAGLQDLITNLENLARAQHLVALQGGTGLHVLEDGVTVELGKVESGARVPLALTGETLMVGENVTIGLHNGGQKKLFASVFDIGVTGKVTLLSQSSPSGLELSAGRSYTLGQDDYDGTLIGYSLEWPDMAPSEAPRQEAIVVIVTDVPLDLRSLETNKMRSEAPKRRDGGSELLRILDQISFGGMRDIGRPLPAVDVKYAVHRLDFMLDPSPLTLPDVPGAATWSATDRGYIFDERPDRSMTRALTRALVGREHKAAVRLKELVVHRNRALFGSANLRLDCMVVSGASEDAAPYLVETTRFASIRDNERLPMDDLLVFYGAVKDFLDIGVWVSRDESGSPTLAELLDKELNSRDFKTAASVLAGLAALSPQGAAAIAGVGAAATLMNISSRLLAAATGKSVGLYRTSLLATEGFGIGRHPETGLLRSQDFSFAYEVVSPG